MESKKEMRVYVVPFDKVFDKVDKIINEEIFDVNNINDEQFMDIAEKYGEVYTLNGLQNVWNNDSSMCPQADYTYIRFIEVENYN